MVIHATTDYSTIFTLFLKVGYVGYGFLVAFGFLLHKTDEIYYRKPRGWVLKIKGFFNNVAAYAVGPILIVHQVSARGFPPSFAHSPQIAWQQISSTFLPGELKTARP